jgi:glutathione S-transferase
MASNAIRIVHIPRFRSTRPVWMYHELKQLYKQDSALPAMEVTTFRDIPSFRINKPQWLLDMNPNGKVPTMADDSVVMFEGGAICSYLLDRFDTERKLLPREPQATAAYYLMVSWCASTLDNLIATSSPINIVLDRANAPRPMDSVDVNKKYFEEVFVPYFAKQLDTSGGPYLCGKQFTAADIIIGFFLLQAKEKMVPSWVPEAELPQMAAYVELLKERPALQKAIAPVD